MYNMPDYDQQVAVDKWTGEFTYSFLNHSNLVNGAEKVPIFEW
jgi:hypothetical protein